MTFQIQRSAPLCALIAFGFGIACALPAHAQNSITPTAPGRFYIELKDASLSDALELIFKAADNPSHIIDESAQKVNIGDFTLTNITWDSAVRQLANQNGFKVSRNDSGAYVIEPRVPVAPADGTAAPGGLPFAPALPSGPSAVPANPFGGVTTGAFEMLPRVATLSNAQTNPFGGGDAGGGASTEGKVYKIIIVRHIYAGGVAKLFNNSSVISTESFVAPDSAQSGGAGGAAGGSRAGSTGGIGGFGTTSIGGATGGTGSTGTSGFGGFGGTTGGTTGGIGGLGF